MLFSSRKFLPLHGVESVHVPAVLVDGAHAVGRPVAEDPVQDVDLGLEAPVLTPLEERPLEVLPRVVNVLDHVKLVKKQVVISIVSSSYSLVIFGVTVT